MQTKINRRKFIQNTALGSAALLIAPAFTQSASVFTRGVASKNVLMTGLTPISVIDNACMLAYCSGKLSRESQAVVTTDIHLRDTPGNKGRLAVVFPPNDSKILELIQIVKTNKEVNLAKEKRALIFGWAAINAVDRHINKSLKNKQPEDILTARFHQDALVIQGFSSPEYHVQGAGKQDVEDMLNAILVRTITRVHTLKPDADDGIGWVNRMSDWRKSNKEMMRRFAEAIVSPNRSIAGQNFYSVHESIIQTANNLQKAEMITAEEVLDSIIRPGESDYGKALAEATNNILLIEDYFQDKISMAELEKIVIKNNDN